MSSWKGVIVPGYLDSLQGVDAIRYSKKIELCCGIDPYQLKSSEISRDVKLFPCIEYADIVNYLVFSTNSVTKEQMKARKSLEAHNYLTSGFVNPEILAQRLPDKNIILIGKVNHSQKLRVPPLKAWILAKPSGEIITAHCICMAGKGEACSHIGAVLFYVDLAVRHRESITCTQELSTWLPPHLKHVPYLKVKDMDFSSAKNKKMKLDKPSSTIVTASQNMKETEILKPSDEEMTIFFTDIFKIKSNSAILRILPGAFSDQFVDVIVELPATLTDIYSVDMTKLGWSDLLEKCEMIFQGIKVSKEMTLNAEEKTRKQANCKLWFVLRAGRITASNMKAVCHTDPAKPSLSLINKICYPTQVRFSNDATRWGCKHEKEAVDTYTRILKERHKKFVVKNAGFHINQDFPYIGATPDGIVACDCCGKGACEVKCPYCLRDKNIEELSSTSTSNCLINVDGQPQLNNKHAYYYQVQTQIYVCSLN